MFNYMSTFSNQLASQRSLYLKQHSTNPVNWLPWTQSSFQLARQLNRPIFLSIGYSTCHWCHVMEHESFQHPQIAQLLNTNYIPIKVDREEQPNVDRAYMTFLQATSGRGGWPLSVFLEPQELKPFYAGTFIPREDKYGVVGFERILTTISERWRTHKQKLVETGQSVISELNRVVNVSERGEYSQETVENVFKEIEQRFDVMQGGFSDAPKFPMPAIMSFLFRYYDWAGEEKAEKAVRMAVRTIKCIGDGGVYDQIGEGMHRYSVDAYWHVPHFEKMVYDQAQMISVLLEGFYVSGDEYCKEKAKGILDYCERELTKEGFGFYAAQDADSYPLGSGTEKKEGAFYVYEYKELEKILNSDELKLVERVLGVCKEGNIRPESDPHGELKDKNVFFIEKSVDAYAKEMQLDAKDMRNVFSQAKKKIFADREMRPKPATDRKTWNGLMLSALAKASSCFGDDYYLRKAREVVDIIQSHLKDGKLPRVIYKEQGVHIEGSADDYAFTIQGLIDLYNHSFDESFLSFAVELQEKQNLFFLDKEQGGYFSAAHDAENIVLRLKEWQDGAEPSVNGVIASNLIRLSWMLDNKHEQYQQFAKGIFDAFMAGKQSFGMSTLSSAYMLYLQPLKLVSFNVIFGYDLWK